ncbi:hypothetical protein D0C36_02940 [Mucilaginibacter conchicola]|uniref:Uncharacterized protein n=1 Tax=Mucilaginibacter conchicola TaxID=2303333 RepID=A0A372NWN6_9SPHI|nr:hypothetical protein [Mucilaginibacter conchicola]RFZ94518.1 hypothetical protein D0C36_02940 [Mucilaginibacter conchicola]
MFKSKLLFFSVLVFLIVNTLYFWEGALGGFNMLLWPFLAIVVTVLFFGALRQLYFAAKEHFKNKQRLYKACLVLLLLALIALRPYGIINYSDFESKSVLIAGREGVANCTTTLMLKQNGRFKMRNICFGIDDEIGLYTINKDTIKFSNPSSRNTNRYDYAVLDSTKRNLIFKKGNKVVPPTILAVVHNETELR